MLELLQYSPILIIVLAIWAIPWKGVALWRAARNGQKKWFIAIFLLNTLAILEIIYIFFFSKKSKTENDKFKID